MKILDRALIVLFNFCLLLVTIILSAVCVAGSENFYHRQFEKTGVYAQIENGAEYRLKIHYVNGGDYTDWATFSDEQLDEIVEHIISYLFTDQESFKLVMDDVAYKGVETDGVSVFGDISVGHMVDVKELFQFFIGLAWGLGISLLAIIGYFIWRRKEVKKLFLKYTLIFYGIFVGLIGIFCGWALIDVLRNDWGMENYTRVLWANFHHLIFPFQADKFAGSFFADPLTEILTLDLFMGAVVTVLIVVAIVLLAWFVFSFCCWFFEKKNRKKSDAV